MMSEVDKAGRIVAIKAFYYISQLERPTKQLHLVSFPALPINLRDIINILLTRFLRTYCKSQSSFSYVD